jgi:4-hydroxyacetophenone monooxygenase
MDEAELRSALDEADVRVLLMVLVHLTGDRRWMQAPYLPVRDVRLFADESAGLDEALQAEVRETVLLEILREDLVPALPRPTAAQLLEMMSVCLGEVVPPEYGPLVLQEMQLDDGGDAPAAVADGTRALVIGAGVSGLCAAAKLREAGVEVTVLERNPAVGGVWWENAYPDCGVDTPNHFYSYSFAPNHGWNHYFSPREEIQAYLERCADDLGVRGDIRFGATVESATWIEDDSCWEVAYRSADGRERRVRAELLVPAVGQMNRPKVPAIDGLDDFAGPVFHSSRWPDGLDLSDRRVAVVGTGASAMQLVPHVAAHASEVTIFQRSPQWARPVDDYHRQVREGTKWLLEHVPFYAPWYRVTLFWRFGDGLHRQLQIDPDWPHPERAVNRANDRHRRDLVEYIDTQLGPDADASLRAKVVPDYPPFGKRMLIDNGWYRLLTEPHVHLVTDDIARIDADGVVTVDGVHHDADVIVLATGFEAADALGHLEIRGRGGDRLADRWGSDDPRAYLGIAVPGFPNLFLLYGPNTNLGHGGSIIFQAECQSAYIVGLLQQMRAVGASSVDVRRDVHDDYNERVDEAHRHMIWTHPGMETWYRNRAGRVVTNSPWRLVDYWTMCHSPSLDDYEPGGDPTSRSL